MAKPIDQHEGKKYLRKIRDARDPENFVWVDVYAVLVAWGITCPGRQQAIKKLLCAGERGKGDALADLIGADAALSRAIDLQKTADQVVRVAKMVEPSGGETMAQRFAEVNNLPAVPGKKTLVPLKAKKPKKRPKPRTPTIINKASFLRP